MSSSGGAKLILFSASEGGSRQGRSVGAGRAARSAAERAGEGRSAGRGRHLEAPKAASRRVGRSVVEVDFCDDGLKISFDHLLSTFSNDFGLAGLRCSP